MSVWSWARAPRIRHGIAAASIVLAGGGLVLFRAPPSAAWAPPPTVATPFDPTHSVRFTGPGVHGTVALSHSHVLASGQDFYAEVRMTADKSNEIVRAPLALAVVLDTSGSMEGEKIEQARNAVIQLIRDMRDDDEIAVIRYSDDATIVQPLAHIRGIRSELITRVRDIQAGGGTAIPVGLAKGREALAEAENSRIQRIVLVSDGLDTTRAQAETLAKSSFEKGITISSMGIGLDFDESYMSGVARAGHGNFGFVKDASALATFLHRELDEAAGTTVQNATVRLNLPVQVNLVEASGADARNVGMDGSNVIELKMGSLFQGDERRVIVHLTSHLPSDVTALVDGSVNWKNSDGHDAGATFSAMHLVGTTDRAVVESDVDPLVLADATSVAASERELKAAEAYASGDTATANRLIDQNIHELRQAAVLAPKAAPALSSQMQAYGNTKSGFAAAAPTSMAGKAAAKHSFESDSKNVGRSAF